LAFSSSVPLLFIQKKYKQKTRGGSTKVKSIRQAIDADFVKMPMPMPMPMPMKMRMRMKLGMGVGMGLGMGNGECPEFKPVPLRVLVAALLCRPSGRTTNYKMLLKGDFKTPATWHRPWSPVHQSSSPPPTLFRGEAKAELGKQRLQMGQVWVLQEQLELHNYNGHCWAAHANTGFSFTFYRFKNS